MRNDRKQKVGYATTIDIARMCGVSERTVHRWYRSKVIPEPVALSEKGWKLWSPEQCKQILQNYQKRKRTT